VTEANEKITEYAQRRASGAFDAVFKPSTRGERFGARREYSRTFGRTLGLSAIRGTGTYAFPLEPAESRPDAPIVFKIERVTGNNESLRTARTLVGTLDLTGLTVAEAWARIVATVKSLMTGRPAEEFYTVPKAAPKPRAKPTAAPSAPVVLPVEQLAADVARASALALAAEKSERVAATAGAARQARQALTESRREVTEKAGLIEAARTAGTAHGFFPTPPSLARHVADLAIIRPGETALEPSAGMGALIEELVNRGATVAAIEYQPDRARFLAETWGRSGVDVRSGDFLAVPPTPTFDVVLMNPPFATESTRRADALHVLHALGFVRPGGRLVAIMSPGSVTSDDKPRAALHEGLRGWGVTWEPVEPGRFRTSGTNVASVILVAHRPEAKQNRRHYR
jgi:predicted RNA methylase